MFGTGFPRKYNLSGKGTLMLFQKTFMKELIFCGFIARFIGREIVFYGHWKLVCGQ